jgi:hypothetical protein
MSERGVFALIVLVSVLTGVVFLMLGESRGAILWLLAGILTTVGVLLDERRRPRR